MQGSWLTAVEAPGRWPWPAAGSTVIRWTILTANGRHSVNHYFIEGLFINTNSSMLTKQLCVLQFVCFFYPARHLINNNNVPPNVFTSVFMKRHLDQQIYPKTAHLDSKILTLVVSGSEWSYLTTLLKNRTKPARSVFIWDTKKRGLQHLDNFDLD